MGYELPIKKIPGWLEIDNKITINPYWVYQMYYTTGLPKELVIEHPEILWTFWHETWYVYFECIIMLKSGGSLKRVKEHLSNFYKTPYGQEFIDYHIK